MTDRRHIWMTSASDHENHFVSINLASKTKNAKDSSRAKIVTCKNNLLFSDNFLASYEFRTRVIFCIFCFRGKVFIETK